MLTSRLLSLFLVALMSVSAILLPSGAQRVAAADAAVSIQQFRYSPAQLTVNVGDTVTWTNNETSVPHDVVSGSPTSPDSGQDFSSPLLNPGDSFAFTFSEPGEYPYFCSLHPAMVATVTVTGEAPSEPSVAPAQTEAEEAGHDGHAAAPAGQMQPPPLPANASVIASGLLNPRGFTFAPDGALVVAEAGSAPEGFQPPSNPTDPFFRPGTTTTGRISRVDLATGQRTTIADGLPSAAQIHGDVLGPAGVAYLGSDLYVLISAGPVHGWPGYPSGVYRVNADGTVRLVANLDAFNARNPVALIPPDDEITNPYDMVAADGALLITDGNRNQVFRVTAEGEISRLADLSASHPVTTGIARTPDGATITVEITPVPFAEGAGRVLRIDGNGQVSTLATGTTAATGVAVAADGAVYVVEFSRHLGRPPFFAPFSGRVARLGADGQLTTVAGNLMFPTVARFGPDGKLYVANFSVGGDDGSGQILQIDVNAAP